MKGTFCGYNKDIQEDKEALFDSVENILLCLEIFKELLNNISFNKKRMEDVTINSYTMATDLVDFLVKKNVSFRDAHEIVGKLIKYSLNKEKFLYQLNIEELKSFSEHFSNEVLILLNDPRKILYNHITIGSPNPLMVKKNINNIKLKMKNICKKKED